MSHRSTTSTDDPAAQAPGYDQLLQLFADWRAFERPPNRGATPECSGVPDYTAEHLGAAHRSLGSYQARLQALDITAWPVARQVDWHIVRAEMNGFDFNCRVLQPWARDPAFYRTLWTEQSDVPAHEGPSNAAALELWTYRFPLSADAQAQLVRELNVIAPLLAQARGNLTGNARDLWVAGIECFRQQAVDLEALQARMGAAATPPLARAIAAARDATLAFVGWLEHEAPGKTGPSGLGKDHYTWYQQNVHLVPFTWDQEVALLQRELDRAWASLRLEEQRNRQVAPLVAASTPEAYAAKADAAATKLMRFLAERQVMPIKPNMEPALREHLGQFVPEARRNFFSITLHYDPAALYCHSYHWFELAQMRDEPHRSPIRRGSLLYNMWDSRNEGIATGVEEMFLHMGLHDDSPRTREIVWIMLAQRAARGLGSLYAHANMMTMAEASRVHVAWTPRGWMTREPDLLQFEQHLYLRQPGYGTSYVVGKYLIEQLIAQYAKQREAAGAPFVMAEWFEELNEIGCIPMSLVRWQMLGGDGPATAGPAAPLQVPPSAASRR